MTDDLWKEKSLSPRAKAYARRKGLKSMQRQPDDFVAVNAEITNPGKPNEFKNYDAVGPVRHAMKTESRTLTEVMAKATQKKAALKKPTPGATPGKAMKTGGKSTPTNVVAPQPKKGRNESQARHAFVKEASSRLLERLLEKPATAS